MQRIGILGGTFNPIHLGHLIIAEKACNELKLDTVIFVPSYIPPHKSKANVIAAKKRLKMVELAIENNKRFTVSDFEVKQKTKSYSYLTMAHFSKSFPKKTRFYFIIGKDSLNSLHTWKNVDELLKMVEFVSFARPGYNRKRSRIRVRMIKAHEFDISSSEIRAHIRRGLSIRYLVPENVRKFIKRNKLYK